MAKKKGSLADIYSGKATVTIDMSGADALTFQSVEFAMSPFSGVLMVINRIKYFPYASTVRSLVAATDHIELALTTRNDLTSIDPTNLAIVDHLKVFGMGAGVEPIVTPWESDYTTNPGGGWVTSPSPLYVAMDTGGFGAAGGCFVVIEYQFKPLDKDGALELLQTMIPAQM